MTFLLHNIMRGIGLAQVAAMTRETEVPGFPRLHVKLEDNSEVPLKIKMEDGTYVDFRVRI